MIDELKLDAEHAEAIVERGIDMEVYTDPMPDSSKGKIEAAHEIVALAIDAWQNDKVRPTSNQPKVAKAGEQIVEIFEWAGIKAKGDKITYGPLPDIEGSEDESEDEDDEESGDETAFDVDDTIEDYSEMNGKQRLAALEEVMSDDGEGLYASDVQGFLDYEEEQEKPNSKVKAFLEEILSAQDSDDDEEEEEDEDEEDSDDAEAEADSDEDDDEDEDDEEDEDEEEGESGEPFEDYDSTSIKDIKQALTDAAQDEDEPLEVEQLEYVIEYETNNKGRKTLLKWFGELLEEMKGGSDDAEDEDEEEEEEEKPAKVSKRGSGKGKNVSADNGTVTVTLTREQILAALSDGEVVVEVG